MADPFSVAASAISVVSLGIQVCQGLLSYYGDYKSYDDTVGSLCRKIEGLRSTLEICEEALQKPGLTTSRASVNVTKSIGICKDGLDSLQTSLDSCKKVPKPQGLKASIHNHRQQALYPLKQSNVLRLQGTVTELQHNVHTALLALQMEGLINQSSTLAEISTTSASSTKQGKDIYDGVERIERSVQSACVVLPVLQRQREASSLNLHGLHDGVHSIHRDMKEHHTSFSGSFATLKTQFEQTSSATESAILARIDGLARQNLGLMKALEQHSESNETRAATLESDVRSIQLSLMQSPSFFRKTCDEFKDLELDDAAKNIAHRTFMSPSTIGKTRMGKVCTCRFRASSQRYSSSQNSNLRESSWTVSLRTANVCHHHDCPHSAWTESSWSLSFRLAYCNRLLASALQATVSFTNGAGGLSLSPTMSLTNLVSSDSPAFALIRDPILKGMPANDIEAAVNQRVQSLRQLFQDRKASPYDVDVHGNTLLHVAAYHAGDYWFHTNLSSEDEVDLTVCLIRQILTLGVPLNEVNEQGQTFLNCFLNFPGGPWYDQGICESFASSVTQLIDVGAELVTINRPGQIIRADAVLSVPPPIYLRHTLTSIIDIAEALLCNDICLAVARKSEVDLQRALAVSPRAINETNNMSQTALHLAVEWPAGMRLLLKAGADVDCLDCVMLSPLNYAINRSLIEPIHVLGNADCSLLDYSHSPILKDAIRIGEDCRGKQTLIAEGKMVTDLVVDLVIDRRQRLRDLATRLLPISALTHFYPVGDHDSFLPDEKASQLFSALVHHGIPVLSALDPGRDRTTVYHQIGVSSRIAERLWKAGFRDIDGRDCFGLTPLMYMRNAAHSKQSINIRLECVAWFLNKGADLYAKQDLGLYFEREERNMRSGSRQLLSATSLQFLARGLGFSLGENLIYVSMWDEHDMPLGMILSEISRRVFEQVLMDNVSDDCECACSNGGCKALTLITKSYILRLGKNYRSQQLANLWADIMDICNPLKCSEFMRLITFEELGLTHTCCHHEHRRDREWEWEFSVFSRIGDQAEIDEIQDVEAADLRKLEELLEEFEVKRIEFDVPFEDFLQEYWRPRMKEVLNKGDLDKEALREIGVTVYESD